MDSVKVIFGAGTILLGILYLCWVCLFERAHPSDSGHSTAGCIVEWIIVPGAAVLMAGLSADYSSEWLTMTLVAWSVAAGIDLLCCCAHHSAEDAEQADEFTRGRGQ